MDMDGRALAADLCRQLGPRHPTVKRARTVRDIALVLVLVAAGANLLVWRAGMLPDLGPAGWALFAVEVISVSWMIFTALLFTGRTDPAAAAPDPDPLTTLDILIPVAGEPVEMVAATITAAKAVTWPANVIVCNDGWMAGKPDWYEIEALCQKMGVACLTRQSGAKGKGGNLNHALRHTTAEAILVVDADHRLRPDSVREILGWLRHDDIAFVTTPQEFQDSSSDSLNPTEPVFYRATQPARDRIGVAFSTGNGVLYRRDAVARIGGFSEWSVVEDLHTSLRLHGAGWKSVYHHRSISVGLAPATAAEYAKQRLRWAIDSLRILRHDPPWRHGLGFGARLHYVHTLCAYLVAMVQIGFLFGPPAWIIGRLALLTDGDWRSQLLHIGPWLAAVAVALIRWAGVRGALRTARLSTAFQPTVFLAAAWQLLTGLKVSGVTAKTNLPRFNGLVLTGLVLPVGLLATMVWGVIDHRPGGSDLAMGWGAFLTILAVGPLFRVGYGRLWPGLSQALVVTAAVAMTAGAVASSRFGWEAPGGLYQSFAVGQADADGIVVTNELGDTVVIGPAVPAPTTDADHDDERPVPTRVGLAPADGVYVGFTSDTLPYDLGEADRWARQVSEPQIVHWYQQWGSGESRFRGDWLAAVAETGRVPMVSWESWAKPEGEFSSATQELGQMADIAAGDHDDYIDDWAVAAAAYGEPILLRPFHEMNGFWYPWSVGVNGNTAEDYVAAWRHVVDRFDAAGADNVSFVWSINTLASFEQGAGVEEYYPGDTYVDWVATSGFNWDDYDPEWSSWVTAEWVFADTYEVLASFDKPIMFAEIGTGTNGGSGAEWVDEAMEWFATLPELRAIVWFDRSYDGGIDFRLQPDQQRRITQAVTAPRSPFAPDLQLIEPGARARKLGSSPLDSGEPLEIEAVDGAGIIPDIELSIDDDRSG